MGNEKVMAHKEAGHVGVHGVHGERPSLEQFVVDGWNDWSRDLCIEIGWQCALGQTGKVTCLSL